MTINEAREVMYQLFATGWGNTTAYTFENEDYDPPALLPWARVSVLHEFAGQETLGAVGNRRFQRTGRVFVQINVPKNAGMSQLDGLLVKAKDIFEGVHSTVWFRDVMFSVLGTNGKWLAGLMEAQFYYDEVK